MVNLHRPRYHVLPPSEWLNDPNGPIWWGGKHHLFYQYGPDPSDWGPKHWAHVMSDDLVQWETLPIALSPTPGGPDKDGVWSGCAVDDDGVLTLIYTGVFPEVQCVATSRDGVTFEKDPGNPVIAAPPAGMDVTGFRDPCVWREADGWYMIIGSGVKDVGGATLLYRSPDLRTWEYLHPLCAGNKAESGEMWECPDFFPLGDRHALFFSPYGRPLYYTGAYADHRFAPVTEGILDYGWHFYAPKSYLDGAGRRILWGWCWEGRGDAAQYAAGWSGIMSLPRILTLAEDGTLRQAPAPEVETLRGAHVRLEAQPIDGIMPLNVSGRHLELHVTLDPGKAQTCGLVILRSPDGEEGTRLVYTRATGMLGIDRAHASLDLAQNLGYHDGPLPLAPGEPLELRIFLDGSLIEIFSADGRLSMTSRVYPTRANSTGVAAFSEGGTARAALEAWKIPGIAGVSPA